MGTAETLREQARILRDLADRHDAQDMKALLLHLAKQCERLAGQLERGSANNGR